LQKSNLEKDLLLLKAQQKKIRSLSNAEKSKDLIELADAILEHSQNILSANAKDLESLPATTTTAFRDRLTLNTERIAGMVESLKQVAALPDPVGEIVEEKILKNGLEVKRVRAPLGIIFMIFESRPNVILEAFSLAYKSGNSIILRGGSESKETARQIYQIMRQALKNTGFYGIEDYDREIVEKLLKRKDLIDVVVPRGGEKLIDFVQRTSLMPIIKNDRGMCHAYIAESANLEMALNVVNNAKTQRPGVCNSLETVLVHKSLAEKFLPLLYSMTEKVGLAWHVDAPSEKILGIRARVTRATEEDWNTEYLDQIINCKVVGSLDEALDHIERFSSKHSEAIITSDEEEANKFQEFVDAAAVYWNASTRFTDGFELGLGGELGISTQKLHVRGPVGLKELTSTRWIIKGSGQIR
jgi:glutamate-5-semialdehyde dehydrogenase